MFDIKDKIVLITGGAAGIGASVVRTLLDDGVKHVTILDITKENGYVIQEELNAKYGSKKVKFIECDISKEDQLNDAFKSVTNEQGYIDVVINNAGMFNDKMYTKEIEVNFMALVRSTFLAWELMREDGGGRGGTVINIASIAALTSAPMVPVYSGTKIAVVKFSNLFGDEFHYLSSGVRIMAICFGVTDTGLISPDKINSFNPVLEKEIPKLLQRFTWQTPKQAAQGLAEVYKEGKSSSIWLVAGGKPAQDITDEYIKSVQIFDDLVIG